MIKEGDTIAVGDIHGRADLLRGLLDYVRGTGCNLVFLGDLIDRGPDSVECLATVKHLCEKPSSLGIKQAYCLLGNHEDLLVKSVEGGYGSDEFINWKECGGWEYDWEILSNFVPWLKTLPYVLMGERGSIFVHAGLFPGMSPNKMVANNMANYLYWIRDPFLNTGPKLKSWTNDYTRVVHGHTPNFTQEGEIIALPDISQSGDRVGIDTGACWTGVLTCLNDTQNTYFSINGPSDLLDSGHKCLAAPSPFSVPKGLIKGANYKHRANYNWDVRISQFSIRSHQFA